MLCKICIVFIKKSQWYLVGENHPNINTKDIRSEKSPEYKYEYYSVWKNHPNTNTNIIRFENIDQIRIRIFWYSNIIRIIFEYRIIRSPLPVMRVIITSFMGSLIQMLFGLKKKVDRIQIRILFGLKILTEYEYEYYSVWKNRPNTNTNIIRFENIDRIRIRILFGLKKSPEYEYEY